VLSKQKLELCIAPGAPDPKPNVGEPHEKVPSHRRSEVIQSDSARSPRCAAPGNRSEDSRPFIGLERRTSGNEILGILHGTRVDVRSRCAGTSQPSMTSHRLVPGSSADRKLFEPPTRQAIVSIGEISRFHSLTLFVVNFRPVGGQGLWRPRGRKKCRYFVGFCSTTRKLRILSGLVE